MISMKCKYALKALVRLAMESDKKLLHTADIARQENIPRKFLEQILLDLKHARMVKSRQGIGGGYYLVKDPRDISVADIYRLFDGPIAPVLCVSLNFYEKCHDCTDEKKCILREQFINIREGARQVMSRVTIASFLPKKAHKKIN